MPDRMLRDRIIYLFEKGLNLRKIAWVLDIKIDDVKRAVREYTEEILK